MRARSGFNPVYALCIVFGVHVFRHELLDVSSTHQCNFFAKVDWYGNKFAPGHGHKESTQSRNNDMI